ncbi:MAG: T9SS type A sorting domain-containing protein [Bacteroidetes bacterium]|nr:T9SS type A sorting domain-containing protein [Bacteroidota bacterium]
MKKFLSLLGIGLCFSAASYAQAHLGVMGVNDSCVHGTTGTHVMSYVTMSGGSSSSCFVEANFGDGSALDSFNFTGPGPSYTSIGSHIYATAGSYTWKYVLICSGARVDSISKTIPIGCTSIGGFLYLDANSNCVHNPGEILVYSSADIQVDSAGVPIDTLHTTAYWHYLMHGPASTVYTFTLLGNPVGYTASCSTAISYTYSGPSASVSRDFGFSCSATAVYDYILHYARALRGASSTGPSYIYLYASQTTCHSGTGTVTLNVSPKYSINTSSITPSPSSVSGNTVTWTLSNMSNGYWYMLYVPLTPLSTTANGDTACNNAVIAPTSDANPANNSISLCDSVRQSWDPNEKSVEPLETLAPGSLLRYTIDFENLGNDTAFNIHIQDTLSQYLDASSFQLVDATHPVNTYLYQSGGQNILKFDFPGINLADMSQPSANKGQIRFDIRLQNSLASGTTVANHAGIYFDGNPVVMTNDAYVSMPVPQGVPSYSYSQAPKVYPNPADKQIQIEVNSTGWEQAILSNALGQTVLIQPIRKGHNLLEVAALPTGLYYLQVRGAAGSHSEKILKQ